MIRFLLSPGGWHHRSDFPWLGLVGCSGI